CRIRGRAIAMSDRNLLPKTPITLGNQRLTVGSPNISTAPSCSSSTATSRRPTEPKNWTNVLPVLTKTSSSSSPKQSEEEQRRFTLLCDAYLDARYEDSSVAGI